MGADGRLLGENVCPCVEGVFSANPGPWPGQPLLDTLSVRVKGTAPRTVSATCPQPPIYSSFPFLLGHVREGLLRLQSSLSGILESPRAPLSGVKGTAPAVTAEETG